MHYKTLAELNSTNDIKRRIASKAENHLAVKDTSENNAVNMPEHVRQTATIVHHLNQHKIFTHRNFLT